MICDLCLLNLSPNNSISDTGSYTFAPAIHFRLGSITLSPARLFWAFISIHLLLWTAIPVFVSPNAPLDVIEGFVWGNEWVLGTHKHPPMQAWWLEILAFIMGRSAWTYFLASQIAVVTAFWAIWRLGRRIMTEQAALAGALLLEGIVYYNFTSPEFNPNVLQLPFWALIGLSFHRAVKENHWADWALLGLWSAGGLYTKYSFLLILAVLTVLLALHPEGRRRFLGKGPYIALGGAFILFLPHLVWLFQNDFIPITYMESRMHDLNSGSEFFARPFRFFVSQVLVLAPLFFLFALLAGKKIFALLERQKSFDQAFLDALVFGPFLCLLAIGLAGLKLHDMWATPIWGFVGLWAMNHLQVPPAAANFRRFAYGFAALFILALSAYAGAAIFYPYLTHNVQRAHFPGKSLARQVNAIWLEHYQTPLRYVIGDTWLGGNVSYYSPQRPHVLIRGDYKISPWINPSDLKLSGAVIVWCIENCASRNYAEATPEFIKDFPQAKIQEPLVFRRQTGANVPPVTMGWAILPPST